MNKKAWIVFAIIVVAFFGVIFYQSKANKIDYNKYDAQKAIDKNSDNGEIGDHVRGNQNSKVVLVEYGDYQCPACSSMDSKISKLAEEYKDKIAIVFRNFPLDMHPNALSAAAAAESAGLQGKFWEMHTKLYENQSEWEEATGQKRNDLYLKYAQELGLDETKFKDDMKDPKISKKIAFDKALGTRAQIKGTPSFILNGKDLDSKVWGDDESLRAEINKALENNN